MSDERERMRVAIGRLKVDTLPTQRMSDADHRFQIDSFVHHCIEGGYGADVVERTCAELAEVSERFPAWAAFKAELDARRPALTTDRLNPWKSIMQSSVLNWANRVVDKYRDDCEATLTQKQRYAIQRQAMAMVHSFGEQPASIGLGEGWPVWSAEDCLRRAG